MEIMKLLVLNFVCLLLIPSFGLGNRINLSIEEDLELERQVKLLNKPAIKTIVKEDGDIYDCVDINKQPAFDHPALKDHKIQLKPSFYQDGQFDNNGVYSSLRNFTSVKIGLTDDEACPMGTVPIRRVTKKDLIGMRSSMKHKIIRPSSAKIQDVREHAWAALQTTAADGQYYGASSLVIVYGLPQLENNQFSNSLVWVANEPSPAESNQITVGWTVDNTLYGDKNTRLMTAWTVDNFEHTGCIDVRCPGFVQVSSKIALGSTFSALSVFNGPQVGFLSTISKDPITSNWWFLYGQEKSPIGYWPHKLFTHMNDHAGTLALGGSTGNYENTDMPPMGSGHIAWEGFGKACCMLDVKYIDSNSQLQDMQPGDVSPMQTSPCYYVGSISITGEPDRSMFCFGGPGGTQGC